MLIHLKGFELYSKQNYEGQTHTGTNGCMGQRGNYDALPSRSIKTNRLTIDFKVKFWFHCYITSISI